MYAHHPITAILFSLYASTHNILNNSVLEIILSKIIFVFLKIINNLIVL